MLADVLLEQHAAVETAAKRLLDIAGDATLKPVDNVRATVALTRLLDQAFGRMATADKPADPDDETTAWETMTPTMRARRRAQLEAWLAEQEGDGVEDEGVPRPAEGTTLSLPRGFDLLRGTPPNLEARRSGQPGRQGG